MRINLTKKDLVNLIYMQLGFSKQISENLIDDFLQTIINNLTKEKTLKMDLDYIDNMCLSKDIQLLYKTAKSIFLSNNVNT